MVVKYTNPNKAKNTKDIYLRLKINILVEGRRQRGVGRWGTHRPPLPQGSGD